MNITLKFRPYLTSLHVTHIVELCRADGSNRSKELLKIMVPFKAKIDNDCLVPTAIQGSRVGNYGLNSISNEEPEYDRFAEEFMGDDKDKADYEAWRTEGSKEDSKLLAIALLYGSKHNLLTAAEQQLAKDYGLLFDAA